MPRSRAAGTARDGSRKSPGPTGTGRSREGRRRSAEGRAEAGRSRSGYAWTPRDRARISERLPLGSLRVVDQDAHAYGRQLHLVPDQLDAGIRGESQTQAPALDWHACARVSEIAGNRERPMVDRKPARCLVEPDVDLRQPAVAEQRKLVPKADQLPVPVEHARVRLFAQLAPVESRTCECLRTLRIGDVRRLPAESDELVASALAHGSAELGVVVIGEVLKRRRRGPLLALEQQRDERRGEQQSSPDLHAPDPDQVTHALTSSPVADLVVVLQAHDEPVTWQPDGCSAVMATPEYRVAPVVDEGLLERLGQVGQAP